MTGVEFVRGVMGQLGVESAAALADSMGWKRGKERTVARWLAGATQPSYDNVMEMIERAGLLATGRKGKVAPADPPAALAAAVRDVANVQAETLRELRELRAEIAASRKPPQAPPRRRAK